ncbi:MAG: transglycosylase domain-containing protein [Acutalibacteraceae bacterium]
MRKTDISRYGKSRADFKNDGARKGRCNNKKARALGLALRILWKAMLSLVVVIILTGILVVLSLNTYKSTILENDIALNITASKMALTSFVYVTNDNGEAEEYDKVYNLENRVWIDFKDIPKNMKNAIIAIEDKRFYEHRGVDWFRTTGAFFSLLKGDASYGGSTLTQQLIKNITEDNQASLTRKLREIFRAGELEKRYSKDEILESYLNVVNFGNGSRGVQAAANVYFNKNIQECSLAQCAAIAAITQNPTANNPIYYPENNKLRRDVVLSEMLNQNMISTQEYSESIEESNNMEFGSGVINSPENSSNNSVRSWYMETLLRDVINDLCEKYSIGKSTAEDMVYTQGLKIYSAMDIKAQNIAEETLKNSKIMPSDPNLELGYIMMGLDGRILAVLGSRKEKTGNLLYDRANVAKRQPGSTIKPLAAYTPAIEWGILNYSSLIPDEPLQIDSQGDNVMRNWPENWYKSYKGSVTVQWALEKSANAPPAQIVKMLTPAKSYEFLIQKLHLTSLDNHDATSLAALATGGTHYGVTPREMTAAFQIFGNGGKYKKPFSYFYVTDRNDKVLLDNRGKSVQQAISPSTATIMNKLLRNVIVGPEGTGKAANIAGWNVVGKTGTTTDDYDSWFIGVTPYAVAGIWTGYDNPRRIKETSAAIRIWNHIMSKYLDGKPNIDFEYEPSVTAATYCKRSGNLATVSCRETATGYYSENNMPGVCKIHGGANLRAVESNDFSENNVSEMDSENIDETPSPDFFP